MNENFLVRLLMALVRPFLRRGVNDTLRRHGGSGIGRRGPGANPKRGGWAGGKGKKRRDDSW